MFSIEKGRGSARALCLRIAWRAKVVFPDDSGAEDLNEPPAGESAKFPNNA